VTIGYLFWFPRLQVVECEVDKLSSPLQKLRHILGVGGSGNFMLQKYSQHIATVVSCNVVPFRVFDKCNGSCNLHVFVASFEERPSHPETTNLLPEKGYKVPDKDSE
jgi:hypothetical protein